MRIIKIVSILMVFFLGLTIVAAQTDCPALVRTALETTASVCEAAGRSQLCYGHHSITVVVGETESNAVFENPGDLLNVEDVRRLELSPMNLSDETWAVAIMNIQADLPASTSENVTLLPFGGTALDNLGDAVQIEARIVAPNAINVRSAPSTQGSIVSILDPGIPVTLNGRNTAGDWYRIQLGEGETGWIVGYLIQADADLTTLHVIDNDTPSYAPMQAINLQTGMGDAGCAEAPNSGLLVQTPEAAGDIQLQVNGVDFQLSGTAFLQAEAGNRLFVSILEGSGILSALAKSVIVPAGAGSSVLIDENLLVNDVPADPTPYDPAVLQSLPLTLLPRQIELIEPLRPRDITRLAGCRIVSESDLTNFREGPATAYFATGTLDANRPYRVTGWTNGGDGFVWWRVSARQWVRVDLVTASGNCDSVAYAEDRPSQPTTSGHSTDLTCTSERVIYAEAGDIIPVSDSYVSSAVSVGDIIGKFFVDGTVVYEGVGTVSGIGINWSTTWAATAGIHNVEMQYTPTVQIKPDWAQNPFEAGESWSHKVCQIRVE